MKFRGMWLPLVAALALPGALRAQEDECPCRERPGMIGVVFDAEGRESGVRIALDDFGTGYSSLYHLRAFTPDKIKIDKSFVDDMGGDGFGGALVRALIGLGTGLGATVVAEGVETANQERLLREQGCDQAQGFLFGQAVDATQARELLGGWELSRARA